MSNDNDKPVGAIGVVILLTVVILVFWFGMYFISLARA